MDALGAILLIAWFVFSAVRKKKKREAAEAARRVAAEQSAPPFAAPSYDTPAAPAAPAAPKPQPAFDPFFGGLMEALSELDQKKTQPAPQQPARTPAPTAPRQSAHTPVSTEGPQQRVQTTLSDRSSTMQTTLRHALEASNLTGHAHTESSITGVEPECAPEPSHAAASVAAVSAGESAFTWNVNDAMRGLVLSEILGRPKALQR